jgi:hypothetical protein
VAVDDLRVARGDRDVREQPGHQAGAHAGPCSALTIGLSQLITL